jgi:hypothetical protein
MEKYGKLLLSAYIMKKIKSDRSPGSKGILRKYAKLALGAYLLKKLKSGKPEKELELEMEPEEEIISSKPVEVEAGERSSMKIGKIVLGVLAGATLVYALKKLAAKTSWHEIQVE